MPDAGGGVSGDSRGGETSSRLHSHISTHIRRSEQHSGRTDRAAPARCHNIMPYNAAVPKGPAFSFLNN